MSAADELRRRAECRVDRARHPNPSTGPVAAISLFGLAWLLTAPVAVAVAQATGPPSGWQDVRTLLILSAAGFPAAVSAGAAALTAVLRWRVLSGLWRAVAFVPWLVCSLAAGIVISAAIG